MDMQMMVEQQGETLKQIETAAETTVVDLEQGNKDISKAIVSAKSTRAVSWRLHPPSEKPRFLMRNRKNGAVSWSS